MEKLAARCFDDSACLQLQEALDQGMGVMEKQMIPVLRLSVSLSPSSLDLADFVENVRNLRMSLSY